ncbi:hypothetical protein EMIT0232MI5_100199 [Pseudomonas sp. IT-232MI5]
MSAFRCDRAGAQRCPDSGPRHALGTPHCVAARPAANHDGRDTSHRRAHCEGLGLTTPDITDWEMLTNANCSRLWQRWEWLAIGHWSGGHVKADPLTLALSRGERGPIGGYSGDTPI